MTCFHFATDPHPHCPIHGQECPELVRHELSYPEDVSHHIEPESVKTSEAWQRGNLCGICPYRRAIQAENERLRETLQDLLIHIPNGTPLDPYKRKGYEVLA